MKRSKRVSRRLRLSRWIVRLTALGATAGLLAGQYARFDRSEDFINVALPALAVALMPLFLLALLLRDRFGVAIVLVGALCAGERIIAAWPETPAETQAQTLSLRVLTQNVWWANDDPALLARTIVAANPDIVLLQEADGKAAAAIAGLHGFHFPASCRDSPCSTLVLSRWPVREIPLSTGRAGDVLLDVMAVEVLSPEGPLHVMTAHLPRPAMPNAAAFREKLAEFAPALAARPLLVGGDFNLPPGTFALEDFEQSTGLRRADKWLPTYPANSDYAPFLAIDHIYINSRWSATSCERLPPVGSDHLGILCQLRVEAVERS